jgi:wobble nucleotide-excising tRNase
VTLGLSHVILAGALTASAAGIGGFFYGASVGAAQEQAAQKRADDAARAERDRLQDQIDASTERSQAAEYARQTNVRKIYHESQKVIERPVYRNVCVDADGVGLLDRAAHVANGAGVARPAGAAAGTPHGPAQ